MGNWCESSTVPAAVSLDRPISLDSTPIVYHCPCGREGTEVYEISQKTDRCILPYYKTYLINFRELK